MPDIRPLRSVLYVPGSNARALEKANTLAADALILDLEDAVAPDAKELARKQVREAVRARAFGEREVVVRINGLGTPWGEDDLAAMASSGANAILVPKVSRGPDVSTLDARMVHHGASACTKLWLMMETPLAMLNAAEIAGSDTGGRLACLVMGTNDLAKDTRARFVPGRAPFLPWLQSCLAGARAFGLDIVDGVWNALGDEQGFRAECEQGRDLGFDGKTLIHPNQIATANSVFSPSPEEVEHAQAIIAAFSVPENAGKGAIQLGGHMVERLHAAMAARVVAIAQAISQRA